MTITLDGIPILPVIEKVRKEFQMLEQEPHSSGFDVTGFPSYQRISTHINLLFRIERRLSRGLRVPRTWTKELKSTQPLALAMCPDAATLDESSVAFLTLVKYLDSLNG